MKRIIYAADLANPLHKVCVRKKHQMLRREFYRKIKFITDILRRVSFCNSAESQNRLFVPQGFLVFPKIPR